MKSGKSRTQAMPVSIAGKLPVDQEGGRRWWEEGGEFILRTPMREEEETSVQGVRSKRPHFSALAAEGVERNRYFIPG